MSITTWFTVLKATIVPPTGVIIASYELFIDWPQGKRMTQIQKCLKRMPGVFL